MSESAPASHFDCYATEGLAASQIVDVSCMGVPMRLPLSTARLVPLLAAKLDFNPSEKRVDLQVPVTLFSRVVEAVVTGDTSQVSKRDLDYFLVKCDVVEEHPPPSLPWTPITAATPAIVGSSNNGGDLNFESWRRRWASDSEFVTTWTNADYNSQFSDVVTLPPRSPYSLDVTDDSRVEVGRFCDYIDRLEAQFYLPPNDSRDKPLPDDFLETMLFERVSLEIGAQTVTEIPAWALFARLAAMRALRPNEKAIGVFSYRRLSYDDKLALTRRGFTVTLRDLFPDFMTIISPKIGEAGTGLPTLCRVACVHHNVFIYFRRSQPLWPFQLSYIHGHPYFCNQTERDLAVSTLRDFLYETTVFVDSRPLRKIIGMYAFLFILEKDDQLFDSATLCISNQKTLSQTYMQMRYDNWQTAGFNARRQSAPAEMCFALFSQIVTFLVPACRAAKTGCLKSGSTAEQRLRALRHWATASADILMECLQADISNFNVPSSQSPLRWPQPISAACHSSEKETA